MKVVAYVALHYGVSYLRWAIRSVIDRVDEIYIFYSNSGSHGYMTNEDCPETRAELYREAIIAAGSKLRWYDGRWYAENQQRGEIFKECPNADLIVVLDADEVWHPLVLDAALRDAQRCRVRYLRVPMVHFWRSFHRAIVHDPAYPERIILPKIDGGEATVDAGPYRICHMGYSMLPAITRYKWLVHGHLPEYRNDCDWLKDKFLANAQKDVHPVGSEYWNVESVNPTDYMPVWMREHPYWSCRVIE